MVSKKGAWGGFSPATSALTGVIMQSAGDAPLIERGRIDVER